MKFLGALSFGQLGILSNHYLIDLALNQLVILSTCHFVNLSFCQPDNLSTCHFVNLTLGQIIISILLSLIELLISWIVILSTCHFVNLFLSQLSFYQLFNLSTWQFVKSSFQLVISFNCSFTNLSFCKPVISSTWQKISTWWNSELRILHKSPICIRIIMPFRIKNRKMLSIILKNNS